MSEPYYAEALTDHLVDAALAVLRVDVSPGVRHCLRVSVARWVELPPDKRRLPHEAENAAFTLVNMACGYLPWADGEKRKPLVPAVATALLAIIAGHDRAVAQKLARERQEAEYLRHEEEERRRWDGERGYRTWDGL